MGVGAGAYSGNHMQMVDTHTDERMEKVGTHARVQKNMVEHYRGVYMPNSQNDLPSWVDVVAVDTALGVHTRGHNLPPCHHQRTKVYTHRYHV